MLAAGWCGMHAAAAQSILIDDFSAGFVKRSLTTPNTSVSPVTTGTHILGGMRQSAMGLGSNPWAMPATIEVHKATTGSVNSLALGQGYGASARVDEFYGSSVTGLPLGANLSASTDRFRLTFAGINGALNFNILAYTGTAHEQNGCNIAANPFSQTIIELKYSDFTVQGPPISFAQVDDLDFIFQTNKGTDWAVTRIEAVNGTIAGAQPCGPIPG